MNIEPIDSRDAIVIQPIRMKLNRSLVPSDLLVAARDDLIMKIARNESRYVDEVMQANRDGAKLLSKGMYLPSGLTMRA